MKRRALVPFALLVMSAHASTAFAAKPEKAPTAAEKPEDASWLLAAGLTLYRNQEYAEAREKFARAYALDPKPGTLLNLALAELQSGQSVGALHHLRTFAGAPDAPPDKVEQVNAKLIARAMSQTAHIRVSAPASWNVELDGASVGQAPLRDAIDVAPGRHTVVATHDAQRVERELDGEAGATVSIEMVPPLTVVHDSSGPTPPKVHAEEPRHGFFTAKGVTVTTLGVATLAAAGAALYFALDIPTQSDRIADANHELAGSGAPLSTTSCRNVQSAPCSTLQDAANMRASDQNFRTGFAVAAALLGTATVVTAIVWRSDDSPTGTAAWVSPMPGGVRLEGRF